MDELRLSPPNDAAPTTDDPSAADIPTHLRMDAHENGHESVIPSNGQASNGHGPNGDGPAVLIAIREGVQDGERPRDLALVLESLLLVAEEAPSIEALARATNVSAGAVEEALEELGDACRARGIRVQRLGKRVKLATAPEAGPFIERFLGLERPNRLSKAALETLAIIAYRQPITRTGIEAVRGVNCDGSLHTLRSRDLVVSVGQAEGPGRPFLYGTTPRFLDHFGLQRIEEMPPLAELSAPVEQAALALAEEPLPGFNGAAEPPTF